MYLVRDFHVRITTPIHFVPLSHSKVTVKPNLQPDKRLFPSLFLLLLLFSELEKRLR